MRNLALYALLAVGLAASTSALARDQQPLAGILGPLSEGKGIILAQCDTSAAAQCQQRVTVCINQQCILSDKPATCRQNCLAEYQNCKQQAGC
jgi:hypothetical protein